MDTSTILIALFLGVIQIILIFAVLRTAENTKTLIYILRKMNKDLSSIAKQNPYQSTTNSNDTKPNTSNETGRAYQYSTIEANDAAPKTNSNEAGTKRCPKCQHFAYDIDKAKCFMCGYTETTNDQENTKSSIDLDGIAKTLRK